MIKRSDQLGDGNTDSYSDTLDHRVSIHVTPDRDYSTIKSHVRLSNGLYKKMYSKVRPVNGNIIWICFGMLCADLSAPNYKSSPNKNDKIISLGRYSPKSSVLSYIVIVTTSSVKIEPPLNMNLATAGFEKFNISLAWNYMRSVSFHQGRFSTVAGFADDYMQDELIDYFKIRDVYNSLTEVDLGSVIMSILQDFSQDHLARAKRKFYKNEPFPEEGEKLAYSYSKFPLFVS